MFTATIGALWSSCTSRVSPFLRTNLVYLISTIGMSTLPGAACAGALAAGALDSAAGACCAIKQIGVKLAAASARKRTTAFCVNLLLKGASVMRSSIVRPATKSYRHDSRFPKINKRVRATAYRPALFLKRLFKWRMQQRGFSSCCELPLIIPAPPAQNTSEICDAGRNKLFL